MRTVLSGILLLVSFQLLAQRECASHNYIEQLKIADPAFAQRSRDIELAAAFVAGAGSTEDASTNGSVIRIPVVIHVIYNNASENISDEQIRSQLVALNNDFRRKNADTVNTPERFRSSAADAQIEFALATVDPNGRATNGIIRKYSGNRYWSTDDKIKYNSEGGDDAWDSKSYLNIWIGNLRSLLGYSSVPGCSGDKDGVVINYTTFGTFNTAAPYNLGRTATHEVGHWLGLKHIWGDTYCGDDLVSDTPPQSTFTSGCPSGVRTSCGNNPLGDMFMNYMDFTNDACMNLFTQGQKTRMRSLFYASSGRASLVESRGLSTPWNTTIPEKIVVAPTIPTLYPNPATTTVQLNLNAAWIGQTLTIISIDGRQMQKLVVTNVQQHFNVDQLPKGPYFVTGSNGTDLIHEKFIKL